MNTRIEEIKNAVEPLRKLLLKHPVYHQLQHIDDLKHHANQYGISLNIIDDLDEIEGLVFCK